MGYRKEDHYDFHIIESIATHFEDVSKKMSDNTTREALLKIPENLAKSFLFLTHAYGLNPKEISESDLFNEAYDEMVISKHIEVYFLCEHHMLPFFGKAQTTYIPNGKIVSLIKLPRVIGPFSSGLQVQERLTSEIRDCIQEVPKPKGVAIEIEATSSSFIGAFEKDSTRKEFINMLTANLN
jgi:GTP cyclohydrolase I